MLLATSGRRNIYDWWRLLLRGAATASAAPLLVGLLFSAAPQPARADEGASAAASTAIASLPHDLSPWSMFTNADIVVKATMVGLAFASLTTWTIWLAKGLELLISRRRADAAMRILVSTASLDEAARQIETSVAGRGGGGDLVKAALLEMRRSAGLSAEGARAPSDRAYPHRGARRPRYGKGRRIARNDRVDGPVCRTVRHCLGHYEQLHRN